MDRPKAKERTDNPVTDHSDEKTETPSVDVVTQAPREDEDGTKTLSVEPEERDDEGVETQTRREKKRARYDEIQRERDEERRLRMEAEARAAALWAQQQAQAAQPREAPKDPLDDEEKAIRTEWKNHVDLGNTMNGAPKELQDQWHEKYWDIQNRIHSLAAKREARKNQANAPNIDAEVQRAYLRSNYPDFIDNEQAQLYAQGLMFTRLAEQRRRAPTLQDYDHVMKETRRALRMPGAESPGPSPEVRRKFAGVGLGGPSNGASSNRTDITMNEDMMKIARSTYTHERDPKTGKLRKLKPEEADAKWAQKIGKRVVAKHG